MKRLINWFKLYRLKKTSILKGVQVFAWNNEFTYKNNINPSYKFAEKCKSHYISGGIYDSNDITYIHTIQQSSHRFFDVYYNSKGIYASVEILDTPQGLIIKNLIHNYGINCIKFIPRAVYTQNVIQEFITFDIGLSDNMYQSDKLLNLMK